MTQAGNPTPIDRVCLEARIVAADLGPVRNSVERWLTGREGGAWRADDSNASFDLCPDEGGLSVFLRATGEDALRTLGWHGCELVGALGEAAGEVALTWVRHPCRRCLVEVVTD